MESWVVRFQENECRIEQIRRPPQIDMDLYSRQIETYDLKTMERLIQLNVLLIGMKGVGVETAKNVILAGPRSVILHDNNVTQMRDLNTNFYLTEACVTSELSRADGCVRALSGLNPNVDVSVYTGDINEQFLLDSHISAIAIATHMPKKKLVELDMICRRHDILFLIGIVHGLSCTIFTDFGDQFTVWDEDGRPEKDIGILRIEPKLASNHIAVVYTEKKHLYSDGDFVVFSELEGSIELNGQTFQISTDPKKPQSFEIQASGFTPCVNDRGNCLRQKQPVTLKFRSLEESLLNPVAEGLKKLLNPDEGKRRRSSHLHFGVLAAWEFHDSHGFFPEFENDNHAEECVKIAHKLFDKHKLKAKNPTVKVLDESVIRNVASYFQTELVGLTAAVGGLVAQEVIKKTGKCTPIRQWMHFDVFEMLKNKNTTDEHSKLGHSRYEDQERIFGSNFQSKLENMKIFMIGAGALGCEYLKDLAMMGVACGPKGKLYVADMDSIVISNLNRQFLFRVEDVGSSKSECAVKAVASMNPETAGMSDVQLLNNDLEGKHQFVEPKYVSKNIEVSPQTEHVFDFSFYESLDVVITAVDNRNARLYVDSKCLLHQKPLLESGTLGLTGQTHIFLPGLTRSYSDILHKDKEAASIPVCTLKHFPYEIQHCIEWAREQFSNLFTFGPQTAKQFLEDKLKFFEQLEHERSDLGKQNKLQTVKKWTANVNRISLEVLVEMALGIFHKEFRNDIIDLTASFPKDFTIGDHPIPYWMGKRRFPATIEFDLSDDLHMSFILSATNIFASIVGLSQRVFKHDLLRILRNYTSPNYVASKSLKVASETEIEEIVSDSSDQQIHNLKQILLELSPEAECILSPVEFEKDDEKNHHIDFITAFANLRATNYDIPLADRHRCKVIAGKIEPAVATSTAVVTGLNTIELMKLAIGVEKFELSDFRSNQVMLACPSFLVMMRPVPPMRVKTIEQDPIFMSKSVAVPEGFSKWDTIHLKGKLTLGEFIKRLSQQHHGIRIDALRKHGRDVTKSLDLSDNSKDLRHLYIESYGTLHDSQPIILSGSFRDTNGDFAKIPRICCTLK